MFMGIFRKQENLSLGVRGEKAAANYLKKCGYKILATNFFNPKGRRLGEIDIVAEDGKDLVFIEVKTRKASFVNTILPEESVTRSKLYKLNKTAHFYLSKNGLLDAPYRFDALAILANPGNNCCVIKHFKNIFL